MLIEALQKQHLYYGDTLKVAFPTGSGNLLNLGEVAAALSKRLTGLFVRDEEGKRPFAAPLPTRPPTGAICSSSTNASTGTVALVWARPIKPAGRGWWQRFCSH